MSSKLFFSLSLKASKNLLFLQCVNIQCIDGFGGIAGI
jgi:hypothetical protein